MRERNKGQDSSERGQNHRPRALHRGLDDRAIVVKAGREVVLDLLCQD